MTECKKTDSGSPPSYKGGELAISSIKMELSESLAHTHRLREQLHAFAKANGCLINTLAYKDIKNKD